MALEIKPAYTDFFGHYLMTEPEYGSPESPEEGLYDYARYHWSFDEWWLGEHLTGVCAAIVNRYYNWEIWTKDFNAFNETLKRKFQQYKDYFMDLLIAYEQYIAFDDSNKVQRTHDETSVSTPRAKYENVNYDLPRSSSSVDRPTTKSTNGGVEGTDSVRNAGDVVIKGGDNLSFKKKRMELCRNIYDEFASKFESCFIGQFDYTEEEV